MRVVVGRLQPIEQSDSRPLPSPPSLSLSSFPFFSTGKDIHSTPSSSSSPPSLLTRRISSQATLQPPRAAYSHASPFERPATVPSSPNPPSPSFPPTPSQPTPQSRTTLLHCMSSSTLLALKAATLAATVLSASTVRAAQEPGTFEIVGNSGVSAQQVRCRLSPSPFRSSLSCLCCSWE